MLHFLEWMSQEQISFRIKMVFTQPQMSLVKGVKLFLALTSLEIVEIISKGMIDTPMYFVPDCNIMTKPQGVKALGFFIAYL
jgi:hypothetical protein